MRPHLPTGRDSAKASSTIPVVIGLATAATTGGLLWFLGRRRRRNGTRPIQTTRSL